MHSAGGFAIRTRFRDSARLRTPVPLRIVAIACGRFEDGDKMRFILR